MGAGRGGARRHVRAEAQSPAQGEAPQLLEGGGAHVAASVDGSMAAAARPLEALELVEEEGGVGRVLTPKTDSLKTVSGPAAVSFMSRPHQLLLLQ